MAGVGWGAAGGPGFGTFGQDTGKVPGNQSVASWSAPSSTTAAAPASNPFPPPGGSDAVQAYTPSETTSQAAAPQTTTPAADPGSPTSVYSAPQQTGHWDLGEQGAAGSWTNGYNPQYEYDQQSSAQQPVTGSQAQASSASADQTSTPAATPTDGGYDPLAFMHTDAFRNNNNSAAGGGASGYGDARDNPNNTMGVFYDPSARQGDVTGYYNDFNDPSLRSNPNGQAVSLAQAGITPGSVGDPTWYPNGYQAPGSPASVYSPPKEKIVAPFGSKDWAV